MSRSRRTDPREIVDGAKRGLHAARSTYTQRRGRADHIGMAIALRAALGPDDDSIDVGAHLGEVTQQLRESAPGGRVLAVEPIPYLAAKLRSSMGSEVIIEEAALTDGEPGELEFLHVVNNPGYSGFKERDYPEAPEFEKLTVKTQQLDALVEKHGIKPRFIKIDVEGAELLVLRSARQTIQEFRPVIAVEHGSAAEGYGETPATFFDLATELGLRVFNFDGDAPYTRDTFVRAVRPDGFFNFLLRP